MSSIKIANKNTNYIADRFIQLIAVYMLILSIFIAYTSIFEIGISVLEVMIPLLITTIVSYCMQLIKWRIKWIISSVLILCLFVALFMQNIIQMLNGIIPYVNSFIELSNKYYDRNEATIPYLSEPYDVIMVCCLICFVLSFVLSFIIRKKKLLILAIGIMMIPVILSAMVGYMPQTYASWLLIIASSIYIVFYNVSSATFPKRELIKITALFSVLFIGATILTPQVIKQEQKHERVYFDIREEIKRQQNGQKPAKPIETPKIPELLPIKGDYATGGVSKGDFTDLSKFTPRGTETIVITTVEKPKAPMYLRGYIGTHYTQNGWEEISEEVINNNEYSSEWNEHYYYEIQQTPYDRIGGDVNAISQYLGIEYLEDKDEFAFLPYFTALTSYENIKFDAYVVRKDSYAQSYYFYDRADVEEQNIDMENTYVSEVWEDYCNFVDEIYIEQSNVQTIKSVCQRFDKDSIKSLGKDINNYLMRECAYNTNPGKCPDGAEFVEYFLSINKKGFCVHFATAATLMYRECGYPARYVEGYVVDVDDFVLQENGIYKAVVTDEMAHAWCETFKEDFGWTPKEHTVGYNGVPSQAGSGSESETPEVESQSVVDQEETTTAQAQQEVKGDKGNAAKTDEGNKLVKVIINILVKILFVIIVGFICIILCVVQKNIRVKRRIKSFHKKSKNKGITNIYNAIYEICVFVDMKKQKKPDREVFEEMKAKFTQLSDEEWEWIYSCAEKAAFDEPILDKKLQAKMYQYYIKFRKSVLNDMSRYKKLWFIYVKAM